MAILLMALPLGGTLSAQASFASYECELLPVQAHTFSSDAVTFSGFTEGAEIYKLWLKPDGTTEEIGETTASTMTGNKQLPSKFYFGEKEMEYFGLTGGGLVYFGETDQIGAAYKPALNMGRVKDLIFIRFYVSSKDTGILATATTSIKYETVQDTLFIAYDNVKLDNKSGSQSYVFSFQYAITKDGVVSFIPVSMQPQSFYPAFNYGLASETKRVGFMPAGCYLSNINGTVISTGYAKIDIGTESYPNQTYRMSPPTPCVALENPTVTWSYMAAADYIELDNDVMTCNGSICLFILSEKSTLSGADLPEDGMTYQSGNQIGSSISVVVANDNFGKLWISNQQNIIKNLTPGTTYYLYAFPYNNDCTGIKYNKTNIPSCAITTAIAPVNSVSVDESTITENGFTLNINKGAAERYVLAVSNRQISPYAKTPLASKEGGYKVGDKLAMRYRAADVDETYELEILAVGADAQYVVTDAQPNTDYYYYVWSTDASQSSFSFETRTCAVATPYYIPAVFAFDMAAVTEKGLNPAGWDLTSRFQVIESVGDKYLTVDLYAEENSSFRAEAITPVIKGGRIAAATVEYFFWRNGDRPSNTALRDGDKITLQWKSLSAETWEDLYAVTNANTKRGYDTITTDAFYSSEDFQLRFVAVSTRPRKEDDLSTLASICKVRVGTVCKPISSEPEVSQIMHDRATLSWEDNNNTPRAEEYHIRYKQEDNTWAGWIAKNRNYTVTKLEDNTYYTMQVAAVCAGDTSDYVDVSFNTLRGLPYEFFVDDAAEITFKTGELPAGGAASLTAPDGNKAVWAPTAKGSDTYAGLEVNANMNNPLWMKLPVLSTGETKGKALFSLKLSAWDATSNQQASFGQNDTLLVLLSTDNTFNRSNTKLQIDLSQVTPQGKMFDIDFDVENPYQYWAIYTNLQTTGNVLFIDSLNIVWGEIICNAVSNIRHLNIGYYSVDIAWNGEGEEYGIFYSDRKTDKWDTVYTHETAFTLEGLTSETNYQYYIVTYCDADRRRSSDRSTTRYFSTKKVCEVPTLEVLEGSETWKGVTLITHSNEKKRQFQFIPKDVILGYELYASNGGKDTTEISGLYYVVDTRNRVNYYAQVRALCTNDTSAWSELKEFSLDPTPVCPTPTGLKASVNVETRVANLSWTAGADNLSYAVFVRAGSGRRDTIPTSRTSLNIRVEPDVVYTWSIMAACMEPLFSDIVNGPSFSATVGVESVQSFDKAVKVRVFENQIIIENNQGLYINSLQAFSVDGKLLKTYSVNSTQNAYIYHTLPKGAALLRVVGDNGKTATYKTIIL